MRKGVICDTNSMCTIRSPVEGGNTKLHGADGYGLPAASCAHTVWCGAQVEQSTRSTNRSFKKMVSQGIDPAEIYKAICSQRVELIFTAHPTQARRPPSSPGRQELQSSLLMCVRNGTDTTCRAPLHRDVHAQHFCKFWVL